MAMGGMKRWERWLVRYQWPVLIGTALIVALTNYWWFFVCHCPWWLH